MLSVATWNVNSLRVRLPQLREWLAANPIDVIALQETKLSDPDFPRAEIEALGYAVAFAGQKTYNGVATLSRLPIDDVVTDLPVIGDPQRRLLAATIGGIRLINVYVPNGQTVDSEKYLYKLTWLAALENYVRGEIAAHPKVLVLGDFNIAPEDRDVRVGRFRAGQPRGASGPESAAGRRTHRSVSTLRTRGALVQLVGLPAGRLSTQSRAAHRSDPRQRRDGRALPLLSDRPGAARARTALGSCALQGRV
jgi:exodeoxyribonuclease-3